MNIDLTEHRLHCLYTLIQVKELNEQLKLNFEKRDLEEDETYFNQFDEVIFLKDDHQNVKLLFGGKDVDYFRMQKRLYELIEINLY